MSTSYDSARQTSEWHDDKDDDVFSPISSSSSQHRGLVDPSGVSQRVPSSSMTRPNFLGSSGPDGKQRSPGYDRRSTGDVPNTRRSPKSPGNSRGSSPRHYRSQCSLTDLRSGLNFDDNQYGGEDEERESMKGQKEQDLDMEGRLSQGGLRRNSSNRKSGSFSGPRTFRSSFKSSSSSHSSEGSKDLGSPKPSTKVILEDDDDEDDEELNKITNNNNVIFDVKDKNIREAENGKNNEPNTKSDEEENKRRESDEEEEKEEPKMTYNDMFEMCLKIRKKQYCGDIYNIWQDQVHEALRDEAAVMLQRTGFDAGSKDAVESVVFALRKVPERFFDDESVNSNISVSELKTMVEESMSSWEDLNRRQKLMTQSTTRRRAHCIRINPGADMEEYRPDPRTVLNQHLSLNMLNLNIPSYYMPSYMDWYLASLRSMNDSDEDSEEMVD